MLSTEIIPFREALPPPLPTPPVVHRLAWRAGFRGRIGSLALVGLLGFAIGYLCQLPSHYRTTNPSSVDVSAPRLLLNTVSSKIKATITSALKAAEPAPLSESKRIAKTIQYVLVDLEQKASLSSATSGSQFSRIAIGPLASSGYNSSKALGRGGKEISGAKSSTKTAIFKGRPVAPIPQNLELPELIARLSYTPLGAPADAETSSLFGWRTSPFHTGSAFHSGMDFAVERFSPVSATASGVVKTVNGCGAYGNCIVIDHGNGYETLYGHLSRFNVTEGMSVCRGQLIGQIGSTGRSTGPHLHYEVRRNGSPINPAPFVEARATLDAILGDAKLE